MQNNKGGGLWQERRHEHLNYNKYKKLVQIPRFPSTDWMCRCKESKEEEGHITSGECNIYGDLRTTFGDLKEDNNLVGFFRAVLDRREKLEKEDRTRCAQTAAADASSSPGNRTRTSQP